MNLRKKILLLVLPALFLLSAPAAKAQPVGANTQVCTASTACGNVANYIDIFNGTTYQAQVFWSVSGVAENAYQVQISSDSAFSVILIDSSVVVGTATNYTFYGLAPGTYYWRVRVRSTASGTNYWTPYASDSFTIATPPNTNPSTQTIITSTSASYTWASGGSSVTVQWGTAGRPETGFRLQIDDNSDFSSPLVDIYGGYSGAVKSQGFSNFPDGTYYWRVLAYSHTPTVCYYTAWANNSFTIAPPPTVDLKINSSDGPVTVADGDPMTMSWTTTNSSSCTASGNWSGAKAVPSGSEIQTAPVPGSYTYGLTCNNYGVPVTTASDQVSVTSVCSFNSPTPINSNTTVCTGAPSYTANCGQATGTVNWTVSGTYPEQAYDLQIDDNSDFSSPEVDQLQVSTATSYPFSLPLGTYYWRIRVKATVSGNCYWTPWASDTFTMAASAPAAPTMGAIQEIPDSCKNVTVNWTDNSCDETGFEVQDSLDKLTWTPFCGVGANITSCTNILSPSTTYYFQARAVNSGGNSAWNPLLGAAYATGYCPPALNGSPLMNCDSVDLTWTQSGTGVSSYDIWRKVDNQAWAALQTNLPATQLNYTDTDIASGSSYSYKIIAQTAGITSNVVGPLNPCPSLPTWKEAK